MSSSKYEPSGIFFTPLKPVSGSYNQPLRKNSVNILVSNTLETGKVNKLSISDAKKNSSFLSLK